MKPIRVLQVVTVMNRGGLETMIMNYYRKLDRDKIQFDFITHRQERGDYDNEIELLGGKIYRMPSIKPGNYRKYFKKLDDFFGEHKEYKVVHSHINENSGFVLKTAKKHKVPCRIAHSHISDLKLDIKYPFRLYGRLNLNRNVTDYFACSKRAGTWLFGDKISKQGKVVVLNNAVDLQKFKPNDDIRNVIREKLGLKSKKVIGHVGRFNPQKNHSFLIDIFYEINKKDKDTVLLLIGEGYLKNEIEKKVKRLGLEESVKFLGLQTNIGDLMQGMDLFLFPSLFEGLAVVLIEAQAAGLRCVTSNAVTRESDLTGRIDFIDLNESPESWADDILSGNFEKKDMIDVIRDKGYDSNKNIKWLSDFYEKYYIEE